MDFLELCHKQRRLVLIEFDIICCVDSLCTIQDSALWFYKLGKYMGNGAAELGPKLKSTWDMALTGCNRC